MKNILKQVTNIIHHDVLIIGSGAAGNSLALMLPNNLSIGIIAFFNENWYLWQS